MKILTFLVMFCWSFTTLNAHAVIHGEIISAKSVSTVKLEISHRHLKRSATEWEEYQSRCSAVIVGTKPLTLLTAGHCLHEAKIDADTQLPMVHINNMEFVGITNAKLTKAFYSSLDKIEQNLAQDIAVLVFDAVLANDVQAIPIQINRPADKVLLCGFGGGFKEPELSDPRCCTKKTVANLKDFYKIVPKSYEISDPMLHIKSKAQFEYKNEIIKSRNALLAVNRLDTAGYYSTDEPMPSDGDSGGPWLSVKQPGDYKLVAITSYVERFYNKNKEWGFFKESDPLSDFPYIAYGIKLNTAEVLSYLKSIAHQGADIRFSK